MAEVTDSLNVPKVDLATAEKIKKMSTELGKKNNQKFSQEVNKAMFRTLVQYFIAQGLFCKQPKTQDEIDSCMQKVTKDYEAIIKAMSKE